MKRLLYLLPCLTLLGAPLPAAPADETLAGEDHAAPTAMPTPAGDERGPVSATRSAQAASAFSLPAFVITGGGERKALAQRDEGAEGLDTSGGLKASPGESGAGKDQREAQAQRELPNQESYTARARYGQWRLAYGLANTLSLDGLLAGEGGPFYGWLEGQGDLSDGGPASGAAVTLAQSRQGSLSGHAGWRPDAEDVLDLGASTEQRLARWTRSSLTDPWLDRDRQGESLRWDGKPWGTGLHVNVDADQAALRVPGQGQAWGEQSWGAQLIADRSVFGRTGSSLLEAGASAHRLDLQAGQARGLWLGQAWLESRFEAWNGSRLGLGVQVDTASGDASALLIGPRFSLEQRVWRGLGLRLAFGTGLGVSRLDSPWGQAADPSQTPVFEQDPRLPTLGLAPSRRVADASASLRWAPWDGLSTGLEGFVRQDEDAFLPDDPSHSGLWRDTTVGQLRVSGLRMRQRWQRDGWWQELSAQWQQAVLPDRDGWTPTFLPAFSGRVAAGLTWGPWSARLGLDWLGPREADLHGAWQQPATWDLSARLARELSGSLSVFAEGRNLLASGVQAFPDYPDPAPYAGLGLELRF